MKAVVTWIGIGSIAIGVAGQNFLPNGNFELGSEAPDRWRLEGQGTWTNAGGNRVAVAAGNGQTFSLWRTDRIPISPGGLYRFRFDVKRGFGTTGGSAMAGISRVNRDFHASEEWNRQSFIFSAPHDATTDYARLGQWTVNGQLFFDAAELSPVQVAHSLLAGDREVGEGESIRSGVYHFSPQLSWEGANYDRALVTNRAGFNSDRWVFGRGSEVVYGLGISGAVQTSGTARVNVNYRTGGSLVIEAALPGTSWQQVGSTITNQTSSGEINLPAALFPTERLLLRLRAQGPDANLQVNQISYSAPLLNSPPDVEGKTRFMAVAFASTNLGFNLRNIAFVNGGKWAVTLELSNQLRSPLAVLDKANGGRELVQLAPGEASKVALHFLAAAEQAAIARIELTDKGGAPLLDAETRLALHFLSDPRPGYWLSESNGLALWWCESGWKIGRDRPPPESVAARESEAVSVRLAKGEFEPVQVILTPRADGQLLGARVDEMLSSAGSISNLTVTVNEVAYVSVRNPTDATGQRGEHPDPLPPLRKSLPLRMGRNQPLWLTFHADRNAAGGEYRGSLVLDTSFGSARIPLRAHVDPFALPEETHLRSAFGLGTREINRYHRLETRSDKERVFEKYLRNFAEHRISPYSFYDYAPMEIRFPGQGMNKHAEVDFSRFDAAANKWLGKGGFSTFQLQLHGMGGGTFESRALGKLEGFEEGAPEHARLFGDYLGQVEQHLRNRGWLEKAFTYWFDEPDPKDYEFVVAGMKRLHAAAPGLKRMLTEQPEPALIGNVDIWCGLTPEWTREKVRQRRAAGESVWWYICTGPKAPYVTEFIDHPGTELRLWPWQSWQYGVEGILVWATVYWNSAAAFAAPTVQDPWSDPMSYVSGYSFKPGHVGFWGNGDGRFLYPPRRDPNAAHEPALDEPISSMRWENLRDGMEDYELFWLLAQEVDRARSKAAPAGVIRDAEKLLQIPSEISSDLTHFTTDPRLMLRHRERVAEAIEHLQKL